MQIVGSSLAPGQSLPINQSIEFSFDRELEPSSIDFFSISFQPLPPATPGAPIAGPVTGNFFLKPNSGGRTVVFQPSCPTDAANSNGGFLPGNAFGAVSYRVGIVSAKDAIGSFVRAKDGSSLGQTFSLEFRTPVPPYPILVDPVFPPPKVVATQTLPNNIGLNLLIDPVAPLLITLDQPVLASTIDQDAIKITFEHNGDTVRIPASVALVENCNAAGGSLLQVVPIGVLPSGKTLTLSLGKEVSGFGLSDSAFADEPFHAMQVATAASPQADAILEEFDNESGMDTQAALLTPFASWSEGKLQATPVAPPVDYDVEVRIGPGTLNGINVSFSTDGATLQDTNGNILNFPNGEIRVRRFVMQPGCTTPGCTTLTRFTATGSKPLRIFCSDSFEMQDKTELSVSGQTAANVSSVCVSNLGHPYGSGQCGGGDGGQGGPSFNAADDKGGDGNGPFQTLGAGGRGGHSGYWTALPATAACGSLEPSIFPNFYNVRPGGGGGGDWGIWEWVNGAHRNVCYSVVPTGGLPCTSSGPCIYPLDACPAANQITACNGLTVSNSSRGERGADGVASATDAILGSGPPQGGDAGPAIFVDAYPDPDQLGQSLNNDFVGRKPLGNGVLEGELSALLGGEGGGAGGDGIGYPQFSAVNYINNLTGGGGGGGGGIVEIVTGNLIEVRGSIKANGGDGGEGELIVTVTGGSAPGDYQGGGGGGGGAGGTIVLESSQIVLGENASLQALGGNRGKGSGLMANAPTFPGGCTSGNPNCRRNCTAIRGGAGGKGLIILRLPFDPNTTQSCISVAPEEDPAIAPEGLTVMTGTTANPITCERDALLTARCNPDPHALVRSLGAKSSALSRWIDTGQASLFAPATFEFGNLNLGSGVLDPSAETELIAGSGGSVSGGNIVTIESSALGDLVRSAPATFYGDRFRPMAGLDPVAVGSASVSGNTVTLILEESVSGIGAWQLLRSYFDPLVNGASQVYTSQDGQIRVRFQGAPADPLDSTIVNPNANTHSALSANPASLQGYRFLRFLVEFDQSGASTDTQLGLGRIKLPYRF